METKKCFKCGSVKPLSDFYKHPKMADGHLNKCKECTKKDSKENLEKNKDYYLEYDRKRSTLPHRIELRKRLYKENKDTEEYKNAQIKANKKYRKNNPEKRKAHRAIQYALSVGKLKKEPCCICGDEKSQAHHEDYSFPLNVVWLCDKHHKEAHVKSGSFRKKPAINDDWSSVVFPYDKVVEYRPIRKKMLI